MINFIYNANLRCIRAKGSYTSSCATVAHGMKICYYKEIINILFISLREPLKNSFSKRNIKKRSIY